MTNLVTKRPQTTELSLNKLIIKHLLPDAEAAEDICKYLIIGYFADDAAEMVEAFAEVLGHEVRRGGGLQAGMDAGEGGGGVLKGFEVTGIGYQRGFGGGTEGTPAIRKSLAQRVQTNAFLG